MIETKQITGVSQKLKDVNQLVGNTPLYEIRKVFQKEGVKIFAKLEWMQIGHSVKTRPAFQIIKQALEDGHLGNGKRLLDASSGNTAVAYAAIGAALDVAVTLVVPENVSTQKLANLRALGAEIIFSSKFEGTDGAQTKALELATDYPEVYWYADQYNNENNWKSHYLTTGKEIFEGTSGSVTHFIAGLGTTGTFTGTTISLKESNPDIACIALHPELPMHGLEGWKHMETAKIPGIYKPELADKDLEISTEEAYEMLKETGMKEGLTLSPSAAANLAGAIKLAQTIDRGTIVTVFPDAGYNYPEVLKEIFT